MAKFAGFLRKCPTTCCQDYSAHASDDHVPHQSRSKTPSLLVSNTEEQGLWKRDRFSIKKLVLILNLVIVL